MNRFYQMVDIDHSNRGYQGTVFVGVSFRDEKGITATNNKKLYKANEDTDFKTIIFYSTSTSLECGTKTETSSDWIPVGGPIKGSYAVKNGSD